MTSVFCAKDLIVGQGKFILDKINFKSETGKIIGVIGASGSGKSTLIRVLVGLNKKISGDFYLSVDGKKVDLANRLGYSPQENSLYNYLTLSENLRLFSDFHGIDRLSFDRRKKVLLERLHLTPFEHKLIDTFSGGMKKRADIALALIHDPEVIILDEPFNGLDVSLQDFIWKLLQEFSLKGKLVIISSHYLEDVDKFADEIFLIHKKKFYDYEALQKKIGYKGSLVKFMKKILALDRSDK